MTTASDIETAYRAYDSRNWEEAYSRLSRADRDDTLDATALAMLGNAAYLTARDSEAAEYWTRAHNQFVDEGQIRSAARVGFVLSLTSLLRGEASVSGGWLARTQRLLDTAAERCVEGGYCALLHGLRQLHGSDPVSALAVFDGAIDLAMAADDADLLALSLLSRGEALVALGRPKEGVACLDEAMVLVTGGNVSAIYCGIVYCAVILACQSIFDAERATEWTMAFTTWCERQPDLVPFRGQCIVHRSEILQMRGDWQAALAEADRACRLSARKSDVTLARACYQKGQMHRLFGDLDLAERSYQDAMRNGFDPQPGHALLRLDGGHLSAAVAAIQTACGARFGATEFVGKRDRLKLLGPAVDIFLGAGLIEQAALAADELAAAAQTYEMPLLKATSKTATGRILASTERLGEAFDAFTAAVAMWQRLGMPYEGACARVNLADICQRLGDLETARMHGAAARETFGKLGALPRLSAIERMPWTDNQPARLGLTARQLDVLRMLASGSSNREIASMLDISEHTVARHVSNIFDKIGVSTRAAAVDLAHRERLLD